MTVSRLLSNSTGLPTLLIFLVFGMDLFASLKEDSVGLIKSIVLFCLLIISAIIFCRKSKFHFAAPSLPFCLLYIYLILLIVRLVNDFIFEDHVLFIYKSSITLFAIVSLTIFIPALLFGLRKFEVDINRFVLSLQVLCAVALSISIKSIMDGDIEISDDGRFSGVGSLDIIYLGHQGVTLIFLSLYNLRIKKLLPFNLVTIIIGLLSMVYSASRGPIVALGLGLIIYTLIYSDSIYKKILAILIITFFSLFYEQILLSINDFLVNQEIYTFNRILNFLFGNSDAQGRADLAKEALELFYANPILGYGYLMPDEAYVHNIVLEQFMALGLYGGLIFLVLLIITLIQGMKLVARDKANSIIFILFVQYLCFGLFSRTAIAIPQFFILMYVILHLSKNKYKGQLILIDDDGFDNNPDIQK